MRYSPNVRHLAAGLAILTLVAALYGPAVFASGGDAGTGSDAGNSRATATALPGYGTYSGSLTVGDVDWFSVAENSALPRCLTASWTAYPNTTATLSADTLTGPASISGTAKYGESAQLVLAANSVQTTYFGIQNTPDGLRWPGVYNFTLASKAAPPSGAGDAGTGVDAGDSASSALPLQLGCNGGRFDSVLDTKDAYTFTAPTAGFYTFSFGASASSVALTLPDGSTLSPGQVATIYLPTPGTYSMSASRTSLGTEQIGYVIGVVGPPNCNPAC